MATLTVYPDPDPESTTVDGYLGYDNYTDSWTNVRTASNAQYAYPSSATGACYVGNYNPGSERYWLYRITASFDTSAIGAGATINSGTASLMTAINVSGLKDDLSLTNKSIRLVPASLTSATNLVVADYSLVDYAGTALATDLLVANFTVLNNYYDWTLNASGKAEINTTGVTVLGWAHTADAANEEPDAPGTADDYNGQYFYFADQTGTSSDPKLVVDYTAAVVDTTRTLTDQRVAVSSARSALVNIVGGNYLTVYPDPDPESSSVDGRLSNNFGASGVTWATMRDDTESAQALGGNTTENQFLRSFNATGWTDYTRLPFLFDISAVGNIFTVDSATFSLYGTGTNDNNTDGSWIKEITVVECSLASETAVAVGDFDSFGYTQLNTSNIGVGSWNTSGYNDFGLNSSGLSVITSAIGGVVNLGTLNEEDRSNTEPTVTASDSYVGFTSYMSDQTGTSTDPKLVVYYSVAYNTPRTQVTRTAI